jgi:hypothetical protein
MSERCSQRSCFVICIDLSPRNHSAYSSQYHSGAPADRNPRAAEQLLLCAQHRICVATVLQRSTVALSSTRSGELQRSEEAPRCRAEEYQKPSGSRRDPAATERGGLAVTGLNRAGVPKTPTYRVLQAPESIGDDPGVPKSDGFEIKGTAQCRTRSARRAGQNPVSVQTQKTLCVLRPVSERQNQVFSPRDKDNSSNGPNRLQRSSLRLRLECRVPASRRTWSCSNRPSRRYGFRWVNSPTLQKRFALIKAKLAEAQQ